jgi:alpha-L-fucosidase
VAALGKRLWETCMTLNDTWGYKKSDHHWKKPQDVVHKLTDIAGKGGNFLLNVGPTAEGLIPPESVKILEEAGEWVRANGEAIYGTTFAVAAPQKWGAITRKGNNWYLIVFDWPADGKPLRVPASTAVKSARLLNGAGEVKAGQPSESGLDVTLPAQKPAEPAAVVVLEFEGPPKAAATGGAGEPVPASIDGSYTLPAGAAIVRGKALRLENTSIGYWSEAKDYVEWVIEPAKGANLDVSITLAVGDGAGGEFTVMVGDQKVTGKADPTGGWEQYKTVRLGQITLPPGRTSVSIKANGKPRGALMNLQGVKLDPAR